MKLHNTLTRNVEDFKPQDPDIVTLYTCGPTVYNYYHIGNLRNAVFNDTLRRTLEASGYYVKHVMNITDVGHLVADEDESVLSEDKLEKGAQREGKTVWEVAAHYTEAFKRDMTAMNILPPSVDPHREKNRAAHDAYARATDFIPEQIEMVKILIEKGFAYQTEQAIYFDITKLPDYGTLTGQKLAQKEVGARSDIVTDAKKHHPYDFAVWFFAVGHFKDHTMKWASPWGEGFPGWHLECSAIIHATLGEPIDIHTGGVDHIGTHHPNEMAQTEAAFDRPLAHFWVHNEFMLVNGAKMAKSKGNSYTLKDITDRGFHPLAYRLLVLQAHYRSELNFSWGSLEAAQNRLLKLVNFAALRHHLKTEGSSTVNPGLVLSKERQILPALKNDLNTPEALSNLESFIDSIEAEIKNKDFKATKLSIDSLLNDVDSLLGLNLKSVLDITSAQKQLIEHRETARTAKDWVKSDQLRSQLLEQGLEIDDTPHGPRWRRNHL